MGTGGQGGGSGRLVRVLRIGGAILLPALATGVGSLVPAKSSSSPTDAAMLYLLSVVGAALVAGLAGGLVASVESFLGLNFFFTPPLRTFAVAKSDDLLALIVFLVVSVLVATLLAKTLAQRARAERGEREALLLYRNSSHLLGGEPLPTALGQFARDMVELFGLARCEVSTLGPPDAPDLAASAGAAIGPGVAGVTLPLRTERGIFGQVVVYPQSPGGLEERQVALAGAFAGQVALAVEAAILAEQTRRSQADAEAARVRAALFSSVTHDLRTPLAAIKASATSLLDGDVIFDAAQRTDLLQTIAEESDHLNRLIANLLGLSRLRAGALVPEKTAAPVEDVIEGAVNRLRKRWRGVAIRIQGSDTIPPVPMDLLQIDQVVSNLVENAVKFRGNDQPVEVAAAARDGWVEVTVADHGPGIPTGERERVFEEFYRRGAGAVEGGVGLGLAISRAIVEAHGGSMWVADTAGGGATVGFRLPLSRAAS
jgi:two-component system sensor histidine kinase KdpD